MPIQVSYPGVYIEEIPGGQPLVAGVTTASTAFADFFPRGPVEKAVKITNFDEFERIFGGLHLQSESSYALRQYYLNGGQEAWIIRTGDGKAKAGFQEIEVKTPGLRARVMATTEFKAQAEKAAKEALDAAQAALKALNDMQDAAATKQENKQNKEKLESESGKAADFTRAAAEATKKAANEANAAKDELALAIEQAAAASGPVPSRTQKAAQKSADAAEASVTASNSTVLLTTQAEAASKVAAAALRAGQSARSAEDYATALSESLSATTAVSTAADTAKQQSGVATASSATESTATAAAGAAAKAAEEAAAQALQAAEDALSALQTLQAMLKSLDATDPLSKDLAAITKEIDVITGGAKGGGVLEALTKRDPDPANQGTLQKAAEVTFASQIARDLAAAQKAATDATAVAEEARGHGTTIIGVITNSVPTVLKIAVDAATRAAGSIRPLPGGKGPATAVIEDVIKGAIGAINEASFGANSAVQAALAAAQDAKVAGDAVGSGGPALAARAAVNEAGQIQQDTQETLQEADAVKLQVMNTSLTAIDSAAPAEKAAANGATLPSAVADAITLSLDTAQAALNASNNAVEAAKAVEKAAVSTANVSVRAAEAAETAAKAADAAVMASEEFGRDPILRVEAIDPGIWGNNLEIKLETIGNNFTFQIAEIVVANGTARQAALEVYPRITLEDGSPENAVEVVNSSSRLVRLTYIGPKISGAYPSDVDGSLLDGGADGGLADAQQLTTAIESLNDIEPEIFNILCLPSTANLDDAQARMAIDGAKKFVGDRRAFLIADIPARITTSQAMLEWIKPYQNATAYNMAVYFPRLIIGDPLQNGRPRNVGPSGTMAGVYARTDVRRGVWKAPAGIEAVLEGADVAVALNDTKNGDLNPRGVNVLRSFPVYGNISWGARTLAGADLLSSEWKYINVRRLFNFVEESVFQSLKWAVFEPNNEILWSKIRLQISSFLSGLFADGAFQGATPSAAYYVRCDGTTTTPLDIDMGKVNVQIGMAPVKPAEFIVLQFQQIAGQTAA